jgi:hypothetical protein
MKPKELTVKLVCLDDLSLAIREELGLYEDGESEVNPGACFLVHPPRSVEELEAQPNWADMCRKEDWGVTVSVLVQTPLTKKIKRKHKK